MEDPTSKVLAAIKERPGMTQAELAKAVFGGAAYPSRVQRECETLLKLGLIDRAGVGGPRDPYKYRPWPLPASRG